MMGSIMKRSFADAMGFKWPKDIACVVNGKPVTWAQVHEARRKRQAERLERIRLAEEPIVVPAYVWTFFNKQFIAYYGWYCYVVTRNRQSFGGPTSTIAVNFRGFNTELALSIMQAVPMGLLPSVENFERWMQLLAKRHPRKKPRGDPRRAGSIVGWLYRRDRFTLEKPSV